MICFLLILIGAERVPISRDDRRDETFIWPPRQKPSRPTSSGSELAKASRLDQQSPSREFSGAKQILPEDVSEGIELQTFNITENNPDQKAKAR